MSRISFSSTKLDSSGLEMYLVARLEELERLVRLKLAHLRLGRVHLGDDHDRGIFSLDVLAETLLW